jgi:hypothetical protein
MNKHDEARERIRRLFNNHPLIFRYVGDVPKIKHYYDDIKSYITECEATEKELKRLQKKEAVMKPIVVNEQPFCPTPPTTYDLRYSLRYSVWRQGTETTHDNLFFMSGKGFFDPYSKPFGSNFWVVVGGRGTGKSLLCERLTTLGDDTVAIEVQDITKVPARLLRRSTNVVSLKQLLPPFPAEIGSKCPAED